MQARGSTRSGPTPRHLPGRRPRPDSTATATAALPALVLGARSCPESRPGALAPAPSRTNHRVDRRHSINTATVQPSEAGPHQLSFRRRTGHRRRQHHAQPQRPHPSTATPIPSPTGVEGRRHHALQAHHGVTITPRAPSQEFNTGVLLDAAGANRPATSDRPSRNATRPRHPTSKPLRQQPTSRTNTSANNARSGNHAAGVRLQRSCADNPQRTTTRYGRHRAASHALPQPASSTNTSPDPASTTAPTTIWSPETQPPRTLSASSASTSSATAI